MSDAENLVWKNNLSKVQNWGQLLIFKFDDILQDFKENVITLALFSQ